MTHISGDGSSERIYGTLEGDFIFGGEGDDTISAGIGDDFLWGDEGNDTLLAEDGDDWLNGGAETYPGAGSDVLDGGPGIDTVNYDSFKETGGVTVDLGAGLAWTAYGSDRLVSIEQAAGTAYDDFLMGSDGANYLSGGDGNDQVQGRGGDDSLSGWEGNDILLGGDGVDFVSAGPGADLLEGGPGDDHLSGYEGDDALHGGFGADWLSGGDGTDQFIWSSARDGRDTVADFVLAVDRVQINGALQGFSGAEQQLGNFVRFVPTRFGGHSELQIDADGSAGGLGWQVIGEFFDQPALRALPLFQVGDLVIDGQAPPRGFDALGYIASYHDLAQYLGADAGAGKVHYLYHGYDEGRQVNFDGLDYIASYGDLIIALGANRDAGSIHFITNGLNEGRSSGDFDAEQYLDNYSDLQAAFGSDLTAATSHFITNGFFEGRTDDILL